MVALRGQWLGPNPSTGVDGVWFERASDPPNTYVGMSKPDIQALPTGSGSAAARRATFITNLNAALQTQLGSRYTITVNVAASAPFTLDQITITDA